MKRTRTLSRQKSDLELVREIGLLKQDHPFWGYRRVWAYLRYRKEILVNRKRVYRVMREHHLLVTKQTRNRAVRTPREKPKASAPKQFWGIDMTKIYVQNWGWVYTTLVIDWYTKKIVGSHSGGRSRAREWLSALNEGLNGEFPRGVEGHNLSLVSDNGCQPTSIAFQKECCQLEIKQIYTSYNNPKGNAETERVMRTLKEELLWLHDWHSEEEVSEAIRKWIVEYNSDYPHSALGYRSPEQFERAYYEQVAA